MFTCMFQCLHSMSTQALEWLHKLFSALLSVLGRYSNSIADIARAFPSTLYRRADYIKDKVPIPPIALKVVCHTCHSLNDYSECIEKQGTVTIVQCCNECSRHKKQTPLLRSVVSYKGTTKYYPFLIYPYYSLISTLRCMLLRPGFLDLCEEWRNCLSSDLTMCDVYDGRLWKEFLLFNGLPFLAAKYSLVFMLNIDWFQLFKHQTYSCTCQL